MADLRNALIRPAAWAFYVVLVFEILFMISPAALFFYSEAVKKPPAAAEAPGDRVGGGNVRKYPHERATSSIPLSARA